jgi:hypothetical protein
MDRRGSASTVNHTRSIGAGSTGPMSRTLRVAKVMYKVLDPLDIDQG